MLTQKPVKYIDARVFEEYKNLRQQDTIDLLDINEDRLDRIRRNFEESNYLLIPNLKPQDINIHKLLIARKKLIILRHRLPALITDTWHGDVMAAYKRRIDEDIADIGLVLAAALGDSSGFKANNRYLYGRPHRNIFTAVCDHLSDEAEEVVSDHRAIVRKAARTILDTLGQSRGNRSILFPGEAVFRSARHRSYAQGGYMNRLLHNIVLPTPRVNELNGKQMLRQMLDNIGCRQEIKVGQYWCINPENFYHPAHFNLSTQEFIEYMAHEMAHGDEFVHGQDSAMRLVSIGLDHYSRTNEGRAVAIEQIANPSFKQFAVTARWHEILGRHLAVALSCGLGRTKRNLPFPEVFQIVRDSIVVREAYTEREAQTDVILQHANDQAWDILTAVYSGTDSSSTSGGLRRAMQYLEGNIRIWHDEMKQPGAIERGALGKFDEHNPLERRLIRMAGQISAK